MGIDVLKWIRDQPEFDMMLVIVLTSSEQRTDIRMVCALGANSYLVKPSDPLDLTEMMEMVNRYWLRLNRPTALIGASAVVRSS
jgi:CheY-like chemotaxis protein